MVQIINHYNQKFVIHTLLAILFLCFLMLISSCSVTAKPERVIPEISVGTGTDRENEVWVTELIFDDSWSSSKGNMSCCWGTRGGGQTHYDVLAPTKLYINWVDFQPERTFRAEVALSDNLYSYTQNLPSYYWVHQKEYETNIRPKLIVGVGSSGEVVVWVSNSSYGGNHITGRVMHEVGRGQAICHPSLKEGVPDNCKNIANEPKIKRPF